VKLSGLQKTVLLRKACNPVWMFYLKKKMNLETVCHQVKWSNFPCMTYQAKHNTSPKDDSSNTQDLLARVLQLCQRQSSNKP